MEPEVEPTWVHPRWPLTHALHCLLGVVGSILAVEVPIAGFALVLAAATSIYGDFSARCYLLRRLTFRRASQNVVAVPEDDGRDLVLICAAYDAPRTGAAFNRLPERGLAIFRRLWPSASPSGIVFWSLATLLVPLGARMAGLEAGWLALVQLPQTLTLVVATFYFGEIALSPASPAGNVNGAGVAAAIRAAELADRTGASTRVGVALLGGGDCGGQGMRSLLRSDDERLARERTFVIGVEGTGLGEPCFAKAGAGPLTSPADSRLLEPAEALAEVDLPKLVEMVPGGPASLAGRYGYPAIELCSREASEYLPPRHRSHADRPEDCDPSAIEAAADAAANLIGLLDRRLTRDSARAGVE